MARDVAKALGVERESVWAAGLRAGSVIVDLVIDSEAEDEEVCGVGRRGSDTQLDEPLHFSIEVEKNQDITIDSPTVIRHY